MITITQFSTLNDLFYFYNYHLFDSELPDCLVNLSRHKGAHGFFAWNAWVDTKTGEMRHEISINPESIDRPVKEWHSTLVHEMVHHWQCCLGKPSRNGYHNKEWATKMIEIGLRPVSYDNPGKMTGQAVSHVVEPQGAFEQVFGLLEEQGIEKLMLPLIANNLRALAPAQGPEEEERSERGQRRDKPAIKSKSGVKVAYVCSCSKVWGKPGLNIVCGDCNEQMKAD